MKETFYFTHDYNARSDEKIKKLIRVHWMLWYWIFWSIIEDLYQNANALRTDYDSIAYDMRVNDNIIKSIINEFDLFIIEWDIFGSKSVETRLLERDAKSSKARESARKRWDKKYANALRTESECNAIKEKKEKEKKEKETGIVATQPNEYQLSISYLKNINIDTLHNSDPPDYAREYKKYWIEFVLYWTEKSNNWKIRAEWQKTFEIKRRFYTWLKVAKVNYEKNTISALDITL